MNTRRLLRTCGTLLAAVAVLSSGCTAEGADEVAEPDTTTSAPPGRSDIADPSAAPLRPLPTGIPDALRRYYDQELHWRDCGPEGFQCATLRAPLDYAHPDPADDLSLAVIRKRAEGPERERIGSLLVNPGGPGGSAVDYVQHFAGLGFPEQVRARYDIVGLDPRGVARSEPVVCLTDREMDAYTQVDETPDSQREVDALVAADRRFALGCQRRHGELLGHVSTVEAARDMDVLRAVLGDDELYYVGASYGTFLGATYAGLFPSRVGRLVLDGAVDPSLSARRLNREQTAGFETAFTAFARDCVQRSDCPLGSGSVADAGRRLKALFQRLDRRPIDTGQSRKLGEALATTGVISAMYREQDWPKLREALRQAQHGDGAALLAMADIYYERDENGAYSNIMYANTAVNCLDLPAPFTSAEEVRRAVPDFEEASPVFGRSFAWAALNCAAWQELVTRPTGAPHVIRAEGAKPILVIGTTRDPATPYAWARGLAAQLSSGVLLTYDGDGHTAYVRGSACVDRTVDAYLLDGEAPRNGKVCS